MINISKIFKQKDNFLYNIEECLITIDLNDYSFPSDIILNEDDQTIWMKSLISSCSIKDNSFDLILDYSVTFHYQKLIKTNKKMDLYYPKNSLILETSTESDNIKENVAYLERLAGGKENFKDVKHLFLKVFRLFKDVSDMDTVHLEIFISNILRDSQNISLPARLGQRWDPAMVSMKDIVFREGFWQGLAFENIGKSINNGLTSNSYSDPSILEKVLAGKVVEKPKI